MAVVRLNPNLEAELTGHLAEHGPMDALLGQIADEIARNARDLARAEFYRTGAYTRSIRAEHGLDRFGNLVGRVVASDFKSHWAEFGWGRRTGGTRARHILRRAAERAGLDVLTTDAFGGQRALPGPSRPAIGGRSLLTLPGR